MGLSTVQQRRYCTWSRKGILRRRRKMSIPETIKGTTHNLIDPGSPSGAGALGLNRSLARTGIGQVSIRIRSGQVEKQCNRQSDQT